MSPPSKPLNLMGLLERVVTLEGQATAAHSRIDKMEAGVREDLKEIKGSIHALSNELKEVIGYMNRGKGWAAAGLLFSGIIGAVVTRMIMAVFK